MVEGRSIWESAVAQSCRPRVLRMSVVDLSDAAEFQELKKKVESLSLDRWYQKVSALYSVVSSKVEKIRVTQDPGPIPSGTYSDIPSPDGVGAHLSWS